MKLSWSKYTHNLALKKGTQINLNNLYESLRKKGFETNINENLSWFLYAKQDGVSLTIPRTGNIVINLSSAGGRRKVNNILRLIQKSLLEKGVIERGGVKANKKRRNLE